MDVSSQVGLDEQGGPKHNTRSYSAPVANPDALPPNSPDSSDFRSVSHSDLSDISEAQDVDQEQEGAGSGSEEEFPGNLALPAEAMDRITLLSGSPSKNGSVPLAPRPGSEDRAASRTSGAYSNHSSRPGSERHTVLPPIAQCS